LVRAGAENFAALKPADHDGFHGLGDAKGLAVHLLVLQFEMIGQALDDRVIAGGDPKTFALPGLAP